MNAIQQEVMEKCGVGENAFFRTYSDMYIGCTSLDQADQVVNLCKNATLFIPVKGSDMDQYRICVDVPFAYFDEFVADKIRTEGI